MPNWYTHQLIAEEARNKIPVTRVYDYYFGAQGGDFMFFYRFFAMRGVSPGKILHRENVYGNFSAMRDYVAAHPNAADYALGYVTHYAADTVFHPYVYFLADEKGGTRMDRNITHTLVERDLDACFLERRGVSARAYRLPYLLSDPDSGVVTGVMREIFGRLGYTDITERNIRKAMKNYFRLIRNTSDKSGVRRRISDGIGKAGIKPFRLLGALFARDACNPATLNAERRDWSYITDRSIKSDEDAFMLFDRATETAAELANVFYECAEKNLPLPKKEFSLNLLTGLDEKLGDIDRAYGEEKRYGERFADYAGRQKNKTRRQSAR